MDQEILNLIGAYKRALNTAEGEIVVNDLRSFCAIDEQANSNLTHAECAYRNGMQDMYRYIEAMLSDD